MSDKIAHLRNTAKDAKPWSYDGKRMAFILIGKPGHREDPQPQIGIVNADGSEERLLTKEKRENVRTGADGEKTLLETAYDANAPSWSPVDDRIAFWSGIENRYGQICVIRADGTGSKQLTDDPKHRNSDDPSWSPDGKKILFSTGRSGRNELWVMNADGSDERRVSDIDADPFPGRASWQPVKNSNQ
jgi:Tol biopolymer transport system component